MCIRGRKFLSPICFEKGLCYGFVVVVVRGDFLKERDVWKVWDLG